ncbi:sugar-binding protein [Clostridium polyendosporum]|uniref:Sugar-binding protein n=1 Tax=Clostridium polyendosporum TaxID=69208 RepID=A0A919VGR2_9CLOT|nr:ABC transporter substrate-binding protein [Clostridium polyendosporum]GIM29640.1 sugar-binding protein [Clostridium polyendosporum]
MRRVSTIIIMVFVISTLFNGCFFTNNNYKRLSGKYEIWSYGPYSEYLKKRAKEFVEKNPRVEINIKDFNKDKYITSVEKSLKDNKNEPDMVLLTGEEIIKLLEKRSDSFESITTDLNSYLNNFSPSRVDEVRYKNEVYGFPWDSRPIVVYYNSEVLEKYDINMEEVNSWEEFIASGKKLYELSKGSKVLLTLNKSQERELFKILCYQINILDNQKDITENSEKIDRIIKLLSTMKKEKILKIINDQKQYNSIVVLGSSNSLGELKEKFKTSKWRVVKLPSFEKGGNNFVSLDGVNLVLLDNKKNKDALKQFIFFSMMNCDELLSFMYEENVFPSNNNCYRNKIIDRRAILLNDDKLWARFVNIQSNSKRKNNYYEFIKFMEVNYPNILNKINTGI